MLNKCKTSIAVTTIFSFRHSAAFILFVVAGRIFFTVVNSIKPQRRRALTSFKLPLIEYVTGITV
jgi:hypothetical protein